MTIKLAKWKIKIGKRLFLALALIGVLLIMPGIALSWPTNHLDSSTTGAKPSCNSCHAYKTGTLTLDKVNGFIPMATTVTVNQNSSFTMEFSSNGLGYGRFTVASAILVPDTATWNLSTKEGGSVPWTIAEQDTTWGAPQYSPTVWVTAFSPNDNPNSQKGVTLDNGAIAPFADRNQTAHNEKYSVKVGIGNLPLGGSYQLRLMGVGTASNGVLAFNEKVITVKISSDVTPPSQPVIQSCTGTTSSETTVNWNGATDNIDGSGMNGYEIYRGTASSGPFEYIGFASYPATSYRDQELKGSTTYYYKISAIDNAGNTSSPSGATNSTTLSGVRSDIVAPVTPTGLSATLITDPMDANKRIVKLTWNPNAEGDVVGYNVYRSAGSNSSFPLLTMTTVNNVYSTEINPAEGIVQNTVYYIDDQVRSGTTYFYKITAVDVEGNSSGVSEFMSAMPAVDAGSPNPHGGYKAKAGMCQNCHSLHSSAGRELIFRSSITDACYTCHDGSQSKFNTRAAFDPTYNPSHHKIPEGRYSCDACHNPHYDAEKYPRLLAVTSLEDGQIKRKGNEVCWSCHGKNSNLQNPFGKDHNTPFANSKHNSLSTSSQITGIVCRNCHVPHGSRDYPLLVSANSDNFCISCHNDQGFVSAKVYTDPTSGNLYEGSVFTGVFLKNFSNDYLGTQHQKNFYGRNTCTMCHDPHGSTTNRYMLMYPYKDYYKTSVVNGKVLGPVDYTNNKEQNLICFRCHDSKYYVGENGDYTKVALGSRFGNGNAKNYHNHTAKSQVSCRVCHDPHSGKSSMQNLAKPAGFEWNLNNEFYVNFDWAVTVGVATYSSDHNRLAFIPTGDPFYPSGYSCAITCHNKNHSKGGGNFLSYSRTSNSPAVTCNGCHDYDLFDTNSRHPVLTPAADGKMVTCEQCHLADHSLHNKTNPYGLKDTIVSNWVYDGVSQNITTNLGKTYDPVTGKEIPAYGEICWQCHGDIAGRNILGDHKTNFINKPHSLLQRPVGQNPYGQGMDAPCLTCHTHHSSSNMRLLRKVIDGVAIDAESITGKLNACLACHDGSPAPINIATKYNAPSSAGHYIKSNPSKKLLCTECHDSHGTSNKKYLLDTTNKYNTGITFPGNKTGAANRWLCLSCHPLFNEPGRDYQDYNTANTVGEGVIRIAQLPSTVKDHVYNSGTERECTICHDPHKPWPATGGEDKCYTCHSRPNGEATDIKSMMGLTSMPGSGMLSKHPISDGDTVNNTCMVMCHTAHPHPERAAHLKTDSGNGIVDEKSLCLSCHAKTVTPAKAPYTIDSTKYAGKPHDYSKVIKVYPADDSKFQGNCDKCHIPHGSDFKPMLRKRKDELCVNCHNGVETDGNGNTIKDIKTLYSKAGHWYTEFPEAKMYCDECHIPHGSTNNKYLRDGNEFAPRQSITYINNGVAQAVYFPSNLSGANYKQRAFCTTCHREYNAATVNNWIYYRSETAPGGLAHIRQIPLIGDHGVQINEHKAGNLTQCTQCHNPHDRDPVGYNKDCFVCHGYNNGIKGYATQIQELTGLGGEWPLGITQPVSYHPINDATTPNLNDCMNMCHIKHVHNPRSNVLRDKRAWVKDIAAPGSPTLTAVASSANQVDVQVYAPANLDTVGYYIYRSLDNVAWTKYATFNSRIYAPAYQWFYDSGLAVNQGVYYKGVAFDRKGNLSGFSPVVYAVTSYNADVTKPTLPLNVSISAPTLSSMQSTGAVLSWASSTDNYELRKYNIYRTTTNPEILSSYVLVGSSAKTTFFDGSLAQNATYYYRVTAVDAAGNESAKGAWVSLKTARANATVTPGYYWYRNGQDTLTMHVYRPEDTAFTPTNLFMNGGQIRVKVTTPKNYFGRALNHAKDQKSAQLSFFNSASMSVTPLTLAVSGNETSDFYTWSGQVPSTGSMYQLQVNLNVYSYTYQAVDYYGRRFFAKDAIYVTPTTRYMKTYSDSARTQEQIVFQPGDTVYSWAPSLFTTSMQYLNGFVGGVVYDGTEFGRLKTDSYATALVNDSDYDSNTGLLKLWTTLPATGMINDSWYSVGVRMFAGTTSEISKQILVRSSDVTPPSAASGLTTTDFDQNHYTLSWTESNSADLAGYALYRKKSADSGYILAGAAAPGITSLDVTGLDPNTSYDFKLVAYDNVNNISTATYLLNKTTASETADTEAPTAPAGVRLEVNSASSISVFWNANSILERVTAYSVFRSVDDINYFKVGSVNTNSFIDNNLFDNTTYYYRVIAHDKAGNSSTVSISRFNKTKSAGESSVEGALCMSCHDGITAPPVGYTVNHKIGTAYNQSKHNVDYDLFSFKDGSVYRGNCTKCHVPHGSSFKHLLRKDDGTDLCFTCHESASASGKYSGKRDFILSAHGKTTPTGAKSATPRYWPGGVGVDSSLAANSPTDAGKCFNCHAPHGRYDPVSGQYIKSSAWAGDNINLNRLCFTCHGDDPATFFGEWHGKTVYNATYHGDATVNAKMKLTDSLGVDWGAGECANCHDPHGTNNESMLRYPVNVSGPNMNQLCSKCHDKPDIKADTGLFDGFEVYNTSRHGMKAQWLEEYNTNGVVYNKTEFIPGVCLNCHNSHGKSTDNSADASKVIKKMLVIEDGPNNEICNKCHESAGVQDTLPGYPGNTVFQASAHRGGGTRPGVLWPGGQYYPEAANENVRGKCINCHDPHGTAKRDWFGNIIPIPGATFDEEEELCYTCHKAGVAGMPAIYDISQFKGRTNGHMPWMTINVHSSTEDLNATTRHVECQDCHNTHAVESTYGEPDVDKRLVKALKGTWGIQVTKWAVPNAPNYFDTSPNGWRNKPYATDSAGYEFRKVESSDPDFEEYMLCFKCHSTYAPASGGKRVGVFMNPNNTSSHGFRQEKNPTNFLNHYMSMRIDGNSAGDFLFRPGTPFNPNPDINVLGEARRYKTTCSDCHGNSDSNGPKGPHGSNWEYLLKKDPRNENFCEDCHYDQVYSSGNIIYSQYSGFSSSHGHGFYNTYWNGTSYVPTFNGTNGAAAFADFTRIFGTNRCRLCHLAGAYEGDTQYISTHGVNASVSKAGGASYYGTTSYTVYRGMNGFVLSRYSILYDGSDAYSGCSTFGDAAVNCGYHG